MNNQNKIILDLCAGSGAWSKDYRANDYDVRLITLPLFDVLTYKPPANVYGIIAAPDCTHFSVSGAQYWQQKDIDGRTKKALDIVIACLDIIDICNPVFWCMENPIGRLPKLLPIRLGKPILSFQPFDYGDPYTKKTCLWGKFNPPVKSQVTPIRYCSQGSWIQQLGGKSDKTKYLRSITPAGFARAFYLANQ